MATAETTERQDDAFRGRGRLAQLVAELERQKAKPNRHLVRCLGGPVRDFLSNSYRVLDNYDLAFASLDVVRQAGGEVVEASLSDTHMRLKFTTRAVWDVVNEIDPRGGYSHDWIGRVGYDARGTDLPGGPGTVHPVVSISNSETGHGGLYVRIGILRAICVNTAIIEDVASEIHLGGKLDLGVYSEETITADGKAVMLKCRDAIRAAFDAEKFKRLVARANEASEDKIAAPQAAVTNLVEAGGLNEAAKDAVLAYFLRDCDQSRYGLAQAVARHSQDTDDPDQAHDLESLAGRIIREPKLAAVAA